MVAEEGSAVSTFVAAITPRMRRYNGSMSRARTTDHPSQVVLAIAICAVLLFSVVAVSRVPAHTLGRASALRPQALCLQLPQLALSKLLMFCGLVSGMLTSARIAPCARRRPDLRKTSSVLGVNVAMFQCNPKIKGEKMTFGWVDKEYLDQSIANIEEGSTDHLILDIREPHELDYGTIPYSMNVPASELETALDLSPKDWEMRYGFPKPKPDDEIIVYGEPRPGSQYDPEIQQRLISIASMLANEYGYKLVQRYSQSFFNYFNDPNMIY